MRRGGGRLRAIKAPFALDRIGNPGTGGNRHCHDHSQIFGSHGDCLHRPPKTAAISPSCSTLEVRTLSLPWPKVETAFGAISIKRPCPASPLHTGRIR